MNPSVTIFLKIMADRTFAAPQKMEVRAKLTSQLFRAYNT